MNRLAISAPAPHCSSGVVVAALKAAQKIALTGTGLLCGFDIKVGKIVHQVNVHAKTGSVVEDAIDGGRG